ncbi:hypothetical protein ACOSQ3_021760 [Xanthoceras sorbifolium]
MRMERLRFMKFYSSHCSKGNKENDKVHVFQDLELLPDELRYLHWHRYPLRSIKPKPISRLTKFSEISWNIKDLNLDQTTIEEVPKAIECLNQLVTLKLNHCKRLKNLPSNIHNLTSLTQLSLRDEVPSSIDHLTKLYTLSLRNCTRLKRVSSSIFKLESLESFYLCGCSKLNDLSEVLETRGKLLYLDLDGIAIKELHASIELLPRLSYLDIGYCKYIVSLLNSICNVKSLSNLNLSVHLNLNGNNFESLSLKPFSSLKGLNTSHCKRLQSLQEFPLPSRLQYLQAHECISLETLSTLNVIITQIHVYNDILMSQVINSNICIR